MHTRSNSLKQEGKEGIQTLVENHGHVAGTGS